MNEAYRALSLQQWDSVISIMWHPNISNISNKYTVTSQYYLQLPTSVFEVGVAIYGDLLRSSYPSGLHPCPIVALPVAETRLTCFGRLSVYLSRATGLGNEEGWEWAFCSDIWNIRKAKVRFYYRNRFRTGSQSIHLEDTGSDKTIFRTCSIGKAKCFMYII